MELITLQVPHTTTPHEKGELSLTLTKSSVISAIKDTVRRPHTVQIADLLFELAIKCKYYPLEEVVTVRCSWHIKLEFIGAPVNAKASKYGLI